MALETVFSLLNIGWPLSSEDMGNMNGVSGGRANAVKMRDKPSADGGIGEVVLHHVKLALSAFFPSIKFDLLALYHLEFDLVCSIPINVSDNTRVFEVYDGVVNEESGGGRRVEDVEVIILDPRAIKIGGRVCACIKGNGVFGVPPLTNSYNVSVNSDLSKGDVSHYFVLPVLVKEDKGVLSCITAIVLTPPSSWVVRVVKLFSELGNVGDGARGGGEGDGRVIHSKSDWFITLNIFVRHITFNFVEDLRDEEKMFNGGIVTEGGGKDLVVKLSVP